MGLALHYIAFMVGVLFIFLGMLKLVPVEIGVTGFSQAEMKTMFRRYLSALPVTHILGVTLTSTLYRSVVGFAETVFGTMLAFGRSFWRLFGAFYLLVIMIGAVITHHQVGDPMAMAAPPLVFAVLLLIIIINRRGLRDIYFSVQTKSKND